MERRFLSADTEEYAERKSENGPDSPSSGDDMIKTAQTSPKKSKRGVQKRVVSVPISDVEGPKSKGESYPPSDSWAWRKYGQKPIKGSPYPRGYYRCSSSKGCPARKQVERSRVDPTTLIITYAWDHNHNHNHPAPTKSHSSTSAPSSSSSSDDVQAKSPADEIAVFSSGQADLEIGDALLEGYVNHHRHHWFDDFASTAVLDSPIYGVAYVDADVSTVFSAVSGEDESLFADLGELPECSVVFRHGIMEPEEQNRRCGLSAVTG